MENLRRIGGALLGVGGCIYGGPHMNKASKSEGNATKSFGDNRSNLDPRFLKPSVEKFIQANSNTTFGGICVVSEEAKYLAGVVNLNIPTNICESFVEAAMSVAQDKEFQEYVIPHCGKIFYEQLRKKLTNEGFPEDMADSVDLSTLASLEGGWEDFTADLFLKPKLELKETTHNSLATSAEGIKRKSNPSWGKLMENYMCTLCCAVMVKCHVVDCQVGHTFCEGCIGDWLKPSTQCCCPSCDETITGSQPVVTLDQNIAKAVETTEDCVLRDEWYARLDAISGSASTNDIDETLSDTERVSARDCAFLTIGAIAVVIVIWKVLNGIKDMNRYSVLELFKGSTKCQA